MLRKACHPVWLWAQQVTGKGTTKAGSGRLLQTLCIGFCSSMCVESGVARRAGRQGSVWASRP